MFYNNNNKNNNRETFHLIKSNLFHFAQKLSSEHTIKNHTHTYTY